MSTVSISQVCVEETAKPKGLTLHGKVWWVNKLIKGTTYRFSTKKTELEDAKIVLGNFLRSVDAKSPKIPTGDAVQDETWKSYVHEQVSTPRSWFWQTLSSFDKRSRKRGHTERAMTETELVHLLVWSDGRCAVTGIQFDFGPGAEKSPYRCSIDRIDSNKGYQVDNCRAVCLCVNYALNCWGEDVLRRMAKGMLLKDLDAETARNNEQIVNIPTKEIAKKAKTRRRKKRINPLVKSVVASGVCEKNSHIDGAPDRT